jgi:hypothetical protein
LGIVEGLRAPDGAFAIEFLILAQIAQGTLRPIARREK